MTTWALCLSGLGQPPTSLTTRFCSLPGFRSLREISIDFLVADFSSLSALCRALSYCRRDTGVLRGYDVAPCDVTNSARSLRETSGAQRQCTFVDWVRLAKSEMTAQMLTELMEGLKGDPEEPTTLEAVAGVVERCGSPELCNRFLLLLLGDADKLLPRRQPPPVPLGLRQQGAGQNRAAPPHPSRAMQQETAPQSAWQQPPLQQSTSQNRSAPLQPSGARQQEPAVPQSGWQQSLAQPPAQTQVRPQVQQQSTSQSLAAAPPQPSRAVQQEPAAPQSAWPQFETQPQVPSQQQSAGQNRVAPPQPSRTMQQEPAVPQSAGQQTQPRLQLQLQSNTAVGPTVRPPAVTVPPQMLQTRIPSPAIVTSAPVPSVNAIPTAKTLVSPPAAPAPAPTPMRVASAELVDMNVDSPEVPVAVPTPPMLPPSSSSPKPPVPTEQLLEENRRLKELVVVLMRGKVDAELSAFWDPV